MNNFENPKDLVTGEALNGIDQLASKEELLHFKEKDEILDSLQALQDKYNKLFHKMELMIESMVNESVDKIASQRAISQASVALFKLSALIKQENSRLEVVENFVNEIKDSLGQPSVSN